MNDKRKALGRGLEQLFNDEGLNFDTIENSIIEEAKTNDQIVEIDLSELRANPYQPRKNFDEEALNELASSIKEHGVFQPIIVKKSIKGYEIIAGERRFRASKLAGMQTIPAIVKDFSDEEMMQIALLENLQRENLTSIEEAKAYQTLMETYSIPQQELARRLGKNQSTISNKIRILNLPEDIQHLLVEHRLTERHARALLKLDDDEMRRQVIEKVIRHQFNVRQTEKLVEECLVRREKLEREKKKIMRISCKLYINTLKKTFNEMNLLSRGATFRQEDTGESYVVKITIPKIPEEQECSMKKQNDIMVASGQ